MKLIIEMIDGVIYAYMESKKHFKRVESTRGNRVDPLDLNYNCVLESHLENRDYMVFNIKKPKKFKKQKGDSQ